MKITIFGLIGTGTTTIGKALASQLEYDFMSSGPIMRNKALELNMTIEDFDKLCQENPKYDLDVDREVENYGKNSSNFVFESRLAWFFIPDSFKIMLKCDLEETCLRVAKRESIQVSEARERIEFRNKILEDRFNILYPQINYPPEENYFNLVIDTTDKDIDQILNIILNKIN